ncbi:uncharacterized protein FOMMEDRAFT_160232 [Fomitiporia mediterranea MF3/22]|uniref:uncharacterized protein n=1 Tax=Fomitiporia mediterranea (strain MF3/22) TaxID=694068 RepID=UPI0004408F7D|nr:uncharacterized protein FOMMEDRAFT_160232 [Fomitiporia mediterranea MF3/22]EJC99791.1 hypothetical protein FOMMEDRAFT_160232 [Fomitiporia mediterranea MF3/22]
MSHDIDSMFRDAHWNLHRLSFNIVGQGFTRDNEMYAATGWALVSTIDARNFAFLQPSNDLWDLFPELPQLLLQWPLNSIVFIFPIAFPIPQCHLLSYQQHYVQSLPSLFADAITGAMFGSILTSWEQGTAATDVLKI